MSFANNIEAMAFEKTGWAIIETMEDGTTYMGKPTTEDANLDDAVWVIKRIITNVKSGVKTITIGIARGKWTERFDYDYKF